MTKQDLVQYQNYIKEQKRISSRIEELSEEMTSIRSLLNDVPKTHGISSERIERIIDEKQQLINDYMSKIKEGHIIMTKIEAAVNSVQDERLRMILSMRYLDGRTWEYIAQQMSYDVRWVYTLHGRALQILNKL